MDPAFFYHGIRLPECALGWRPVPSLSDEGKAQGVTRLYGSLNADSPSWFHDVEITTDIGVVSAASGLDKRTTLAIQQASMEADLMAAGQVLGALAWCMDASRKGSVSGTYAGVTDVSHGTLGGGWVTAAGDYVLIRNKTTGEGFVTVILSRTSGTINVSLAQSITTDWEIVDVQLHFPSARFSRMDPGTYPAGDPAADTFRPEVHYYFTSNTRPIQATRYNPTPS